MPMATLLFASTNYLASSDHLAKLKLTTKILLKTSNAKLYKNMHENRDLALQSLSILTIT